MFDAKSLHLSPEHQSALAAILAARTAMLVKQVVGREPLEPDHVYVIPPDRRLLISDRDIATFAFDEPRGHRAPIDHFFRSLADQHGDGFAIVLSGGGSDGSMGSRPSRRAAVSSSSRTPRRRSSPRCRRAPSRPASPIASCRWARWRPIWRNSSRARNGFTAATCSPATRPSSSVFSLFCGRAPRTTSPTTSARPWRPYRTVDDRIDGVVLTFFDMTDQRAAEEGRRESEARLELAREAAGLGIQDYDPVTGAFWWDERSRDLWNTPSATPTVPIEAFWAGIDGEHAEAVREAVDRAMSASGRDKSIRNTSCARRRRTAGCGHAGRPFFRARARNAMPCGWSTPCRTSPSARASRHAKGCSCASCRTG